MFVPAGKGGGGEDNRDEERGSIELHVETRYLKQRKGSAGSCSNRRAFLILKGRIDRHTEFLYTRAIPFPFSRPL